MNGEWLTIPGIIVEGYQVASGPSKEYPYSSLERQRPLFKARGLDLDSFFLGTLNVSIAPHRWAMVAPEYTFRGISWTDLHPPEDFSFSACRVRFNAREYAGWVYYPHPETKIRHFQDPTLIEVVAEHIPDIRYRVGIELAVKSREIRLYL